MSYAKPYLEADMTGLSLFLVFVTSLMTSFLVIPLVIRIAHFKQLYDYPDLAGANNIDLPRRVHTQPMPRLGGIGIVAGFFVSVAIWASSSSFAPLYAASFVMFLVGMIDDLRPLPASLRLLAQIAIATYVVIEMKLSITQLIFSSELHVSIPALLGNILSIFIIVGAINAINLTDGLDGLAGGVVTIGVVLLSLIYFLTKKDLNLIFFLSLPLLGAVMGFLRYNTFPARIFMGDGGSNWLGFLVGVLTVFVLSGATFGEGETSLKIVRTNPTAPFLSGILCISLPVLDTAFVMIRRMMKGKNPMSADKSHFHHTLLYIGLSHSQSVIAIYFLSVILGTLGIMPVAYPAYDFSWICLLAIALCLIILVTTLKIDENAARNLLAIEKFYTGPFVSRWLSRSTIVLEISNRYLIYGILSVVPILAGIPHSALGYASVLGLSLLLVAGFAKDQENFFQSFVISIGSAILLTAINFNTLHVSFLGKIYNIQYLYNTIFIMLLISTLLYIALTFRRRYFLITPTDFLMISLPFLLLLVPEPYQTDFKLNIISLRSLIFFVSLRVLTRRYRRSLRRMRFMCAIGLLYVVLVSLCGLRIVY